VTPGLDMCVRNVSEAGHQPQRRSWASFKISRSFSWSARQLTRS
jgi:hypothetical protein